MATTDTDARPADASRTNDTGRLEPPRVGANWPGGIDVATLAGVLENQGLLTAQQVEDVGRMADRRKVVIDRQRQTDNAEDYVPTSAAEVIASLQMVTPTGSQLNEERIQHALAKAANYKFVRIDPLKLDARWVTSVVSRSYARRNCCLPLGRANGRLVIATDSPFIGPALDTLETRDGQPADLVISIRADILRFIDDVFAFRATIRNAAADLGDTTIDIGNFEQLVRIGQQGKEVEGDDRNVIRAVDFLLQYALDQGASDIHLEPKREQGHVRLRIDGVLHGVHSLPKVVHAAVVSRIKTVARLDIAEKRRPQDGRIKIQHCPPNMPPREVELRISTLPTAFGEKCVMRIFDPTILLQDLSGLGMFSRDLDTVQSLIRRPHGLVLVCGPTGSGKTTTLYSCLRAISSPNINITTIEDPIEMVIEDFNQTAVQPKVGLTFAGALRTLLRQDPDVIMVGEIRDPETAQNAIQAAMTGHLVLSTVHTNDAPATIARLFDLGVQPYLLAATLLGVVAQRLLRNVCLHCRRETELAPEQIAALGLETGGDRFAVWRGSGCSHCRDTGLRGRTGIYEVMPIGDKLRRLVAEKADAGRLTRQAMEDGMTSLREAAIKKMALGLTSFDEVLRVTTEAE